MTAAASCHVRVLTRPGCCLCDEVLEHLARLQRRFPFDMNTINVDEDATLRAQHGDRVPVVTVDGREIGWGRIPPAIVEQQIAHAVERR